VLGGWICALSLVCGAATPAWGQVQTTVEDFFQAGTQPESLVDPMFDSSFCSGCHGFFDEEEAPHATWVSSMMAQSTRDPIFHAGLAIANQDAADSGEFCLRCHTPLGWVGGRSVPADGSALDESLGDFDGVTCHFCHRMVDPDYKEGVSPEVDLAILSGLTDPPTTKPHSGQYVLDPEDRRRGPFDLGPGFPWHQWEESGLHRDSLLCATCHDVSNPALSLQPDGTYQLNELDARHPTQAKSEQFPIERTFTEWEQSVFARAEIDLGGRFGGNKTAVSSCQDCHMPDLSGVACAPGLGGTEREDLPQHGFAGSNSWVLEAIRSSYPDGETGLNDVNVAAAKARNLAMMQAAADVEAFVANGALNVRIINYTGHKLPTGYGEGRRMWLNVRFLDEAGAVLREHGAYDDATAILTTNDTRVYEIDHGLDAQMAAATGKPEGKSFHFVLNNTTLKDNRIPPRGFTNLAFNNGQSWVVGTTYDDETYWDDTQYAIPAGTVRTEVRLYHQTTTKEYIEFLRDENTTNTAGQEAYDLWVQHGKSAPVEMASLALLAGDTVCPTPIEYGLGKISSVGQRAEIGWTGQPSMSAGDFSITVSRAVPKSTGALAISARPASRSFSGGLLLLDEPKILNTFTVGANGSASIPLDLSLRPDLAGGEKFFQVLYQDAGDGGPYSMSSGLHVDFCE